MPESNQCAGLAHQLQMLQQVLRDDSTPDKEGTIRQIIAVYEEMNRLNCPR
jgi:hypothetical protein